MSVLRSSFDPLGFGPNRSFDPLQLATASPFRSARRSRTEIFARGRAVVLVGPADHPMNPIQTVGTGAMAILPEWLCMQCLWLPGLE